MSEAAPFIPAGEQREHRQDDESVQNKKAELIAKVMRKLRRVELGLETEVDENARSVKASLQSISFQLGTKAVIQADDDES